MTVEDWAERFRARGQELRLVEVPGPDGGSLWSAYVAVDGVPVGEGAVGESADAAAAALWK